MSNPNVFSGLSINTDAGQAFEQDYLSGNQYGTLRPIEGAAPQSEAANPLNTFEAMEREKARHIQEGQNTLLGAHETADATRAELEARIQELRERIAAKEAIIARHRQAQAQVQESQSQSQEQPTIPAPAPEPARIVTAGAADPETKNPGLNELTIELPDPAPEPAPLNTAPTEPEPGPASESESKSSLLSEEDLRNLEAPDSPKFIDRFMQFVRKHPRLNSAVTLGLVAITGLSLASCTRRVQGEAPDRPAYVATANIPDANNYAEALRVEYASITGIENLDRKLSWTLEDYNNPGAYRSEHKLNDWSLGNLVPLLNEMGVEDVQNFDDLKNVDPDTLGKAVMYIASSQSMSATPLAKMFEGTPVFDKLGADFFQALPGEASELIKPATTGDRLYIRQQMEYILKNTKFETTVASGKFMNWFQDQHEHSSAHGTTERGVDALRAVTTLDDGTEVEWMVKLGCVNYLTTYTVTYADGTTETFQLETETDNTVTPIITPDTTTTDETPTSVTPEPDTYTIPEDDTYPDQEEDDDEEDDQDQEQDNDQDQDKDKDKDQDEEKDKDKDKDDDKDHTTPDDLGLLPKNEEAERENAGDRVDQRTVDETDDTGRQITPPTTIEEDRENFQGIREQQQEDQAKQQAAEERRQEQAERQEEAAGQAEERREEQTRQETERQESMTDEQREADREQVAAADQAEETAAAAAEAAQEAAAPAEREAAAEVESREEAQAAADQAAPEQSAAAEALADASAETRGDIFAGGDF